MLTKQGASHLRALIDEYEKACAKVTEHRLRSWELDTDRRIVERDEAAEKLAAANLNAFIDTLEQK